MSSLLSTLALTLGLATAGSPDERIVCVPSEDGKGWDCGRGANAPAPRSLPREHTRPAPSAPPPYLMDPSRIPSVSGQSQDAAYAPSDSAPAAVPAPAPTPEPTAVAESAPARVPPPAPVPEAAPAPAAAPEPATAPAPVSDSRAAPVPDPAPETTRAPQPVPAPEPAAHLPAARVAADLLSLPASHYTIQIAGAASNAGFAALRQQLSLATDASYVVRVRRDGGDWWLLLWRDFPDLASARAAAATLGGAYWPRRLAPLQAEVRAAAN